MELAFKDHGGDGSDLLILHGLFGSSKNWASAAGKLAENARVYALDLRNHGDSAHADTHTLDDLVEDVEQFSAHRQLSRPILLGHSMGGMAVMAHALKYPDSTRAVIVVDIAPKKYEPHHEKEFAALKVDVSGLGTREEVMEAMAAHVPDENTRQFLSMNLEREGKGYRWKLNVPVLEQSQYIGEFNGSGSYAGPALFITGGKSDYVSAADHDAIREYFPGAVIETIPDGDHWLHFSAADAFLKIVQGFVAKIV